MQLKLLKTMTMYMDRDGHAAKFPMPIDPHRCIFAHQCIFAHLYAYSRIICISRTCMAIPNMEGQAIWKCIQAEKWNLTCRAYMTNDNTPNRNTTVEQCIVLLCLQNNTSLAGGRWQCAMSKVQSLQNNTHWVSPMDRWQQLPCLSRDDQWQTLTSIYATIIQIYIRTDACRHKQHFGKSIGPIL